MRGAGRLAARAAFVIALAAPGAAPVHAQRRLTYPQVTAPHPYYWRELYLPQLTTGPSGAAWSPDGTELAYSMRGTLWRQRVDGDEAVQLTDGPGHDYQPDWSPDGRWIVFATYTGSAIELRLLDVRSGATRVLLAGGAVHVEPRWSPDGTRLAWVSTAHEGRFHVFVADFRDGSLGAPRRVSEDADSGLTRYYYSRFDQYLSPAWLDAERLVVVSNRGSIWGTGGLWVMHAGGARAGATVPGPAHAMRELHVEETNWKARPDVSPDGRRIVFASYAGRQWHQLALVSSDTTRREAPIQLTYGDFDATNARWSRDARALAFISNEKGSTALHTMTLPGGERRELSARRRRWLRPAGSLRLLLVDAATGRSLPGRLSVRGADGRHYAPDGAWMHADEGFDATQRRFEFAYFHSDAPAIVTLPAGEATLEALHGLEYAPAVRRLAVRAGETTTVRLPLRRIDDPGARGWVSGDLHVHMNYGGTYRNTPARLVRQGRAEGLRVIQNLIVNKEGRVPDVAHFSGAPDRASAPDVILAHDEEFHTSYWGHLGLLGLRSHLLLPAYAAYQGTGAASPAPMNADVARAARAQGALVGYVHPFDTDPRPGDGARPLTNEFPVDLALGLVDYYEALGFVDDFMATQRVWYAALNCGFRLPAGAGTDAMMNFASLRGPVGMNRVYAKVAPPVTQRTFLRALKDGRTFATNSALLSFSLGGREPGSEVVLPSHGGALAARVRMRSMVAIDSLEIVANGVVVARIPTAGDPMRADTTITIPVRASGWYLLRGWSAGGRHPVLDLHPFATTSPVYVSVGGAPIRSARDARFFLDWIDRVRANVERSADWNTPRERDAALATVAAARAEMERRGAVP